MRRNTLGFWVAFLLLATTLASLRGGNNEEAQEVVSAEVNAPLVLMTPLEALAPHRGLATVVVDLTTAVGQVCALNTIVANTPAPLFTTGSSYYINLQLELTAGANPTSFTSVLRLTDLSVNTALAFTTRLPALYVCGSGTFLAPISATGAASPISCGSNQVRR